MLFQVLGLKTMVTWIIINSFNNIRSFVANSLPLGCFPIAIRAFKATASFKFILNSDPEFVVLFNTNTGACKRSVWPLRAIKSVPLFCDEKEIK